MPSIDHHGAHIHYQEFGRGFPILTFAPAGLQSVIEVWSQPSAPINPTTEWAASYRVIAMDQRNAGGQTRAPITAQDGWDAYTADHIAVLDHLGVDKCHLYGQCIGGSFIINMLKHHPERVQSAVLAQPIGRVGAMAPGRPARFDGWAETLKDHPEATPPVLDAFCRNLYAPGFVYCADRDFVKTIKTPCMVLGRQRRGASLADLRGIVKAAAELRVCRRVEERPGAYRGQGAGQGVLRQPHAAPRLAPACSGRSWVREISAVGTP